MDEEFFVFRFVGLGDFFDFGGVFVIVHLSTGELFLICLFTGLIGFVSCADCIAKSLDLGGVECEEIGELDDAMMGFVCQIWNLSKGQDKDGQSKGMFVRIGLGDLEVVGRLRKVRDELGRK